MKKYILTTVASLFLYTLSISGVSAQSIQAINAPEVVYGTTDQAVLQANFDVRNTSDVSINTMVRRVQTNVLQGTANYFCWIQCYPAGVDTSPSPLPIAAGDTVNNFYGDYEPHGVEGSSFIDYCFYDVNNPEDKTCVTIEFRVSAPTAVSETKAIKVGNPQPNPAVDRTSIPFDLKENNHNAHLVVYNILGSEIKSQAVNGTSGNIDLDVSDLQAGVYIYSFYNDNRLLSSSRLVVR